MLSRRTKTRTPKHWHRLTVLTLILCLIPLGTRAGGSGLNVVFVVNQSSSNSCALGNYYCERREVPPENVLRINWPGGNFSWTSNDFQTVLLSPLLGLLEARQFTNQIHYVVLSMDLPFQTTFGSDVNGTTSALYYGLKSASGTGMENSYGGSEAIFQNAPPASAPGSSFLTTMITATSLAKAMALVDGGVASDGTFPLAPVILAKSSDVARNLRYVEFDNALFNGRILGRPALLRTNLNDPSGQTGLFGYETGLAQFQLSPGAFIPGAIADSMTSFGGILFGANDQTNLFAFIEAGAAGSYGTVTEPGTSTEKFPNSQVYFYQARGFSLAESYYQSINVPYQGLLVGEPLAAPFAGRAIGGWQTNLLNSVLSDTTMLSVNFIAPAGDRPLQQIDLFVDGKYLSTLTNLPPRLGNQLTVTLNGYPFTYTVLSNETVSSVATGLAGLINNPAATNETQIRAAIHGDRIELGYIAAATNSFKFFWADNTPTNTPGLAYTVNNLPDSTPPQMLPTGLVDTSAFGMDVQLPSAVPYVIEATTNFLSWSPIFTNRSPGLLHFQDVDAANHPARFYRLMWSDPNQPPRVSAPRIDQAGAFRLTMESQVGQASALLVSTNLLDWTPVLTNTAGGSMEFVASDTTNSLWRFYRAWLAPPAPPKFAVLNVATGLTLVRIDAPARPFTVAVSTNSGPWLTLVTNFNLASLQTSAGSTAGGSNLRSTFLRASRPEFLATTASGRRKYTVSGSSPLAGSWIELTLTKTNGQTVVIGTTNQVAGTTAAQLATQLCNAINAHPALQGPDGVVAEDFLVVISASFNIRARSGGLAAAGISVIARRSGSGFGLHVSPAFVQQPLTDNLADLQPRNHLYVTAGANQMKFNFQFDTTQFPDGYHELTAVAYEGSHVRTQTRATVPVCISNSPLAATLTLLDLTNNAPALGTYHVQVLANTNNVALTTLYSTGGAIGSVSNAPMADFDVVGTNLWAGRHPFFAIVETATGQKYRTETRWIRLK